MVNLNLISEKIANDNDRDQRLKIGDKIGMLFITINLKWFCYVKIVRVCYSFD